MFISFEGLDLSGKTTQAQLLVKRLRRQPKGEVFSALPVRLIREPGGTKISERLRDILLDKKNLEMSDMTELMLFAASRAQLVAEVILPALHRGEIVICDRYYDSTTVYQGYGRGLNLDDIRRINTIATAGTEPDLTVLIDVTVSEVEHRMIAAGISPDRMESAGKGFYERVRSGYQELAKLEPERFVCVNGMASVEEVEREVWGAVLQRGSVHHQSISGVDL